MLLFANSNTRKVYRGNAVKGVPDVVAVRAQRQLDILAAATNLEEARFAGHGRMAKLPRSKPTRYFIHVQGKWWISFRWELRDALDVLLEER